MAWGMDELGGYAIGDEISGMVSVGGEEGRASFSARIPTGKRSVLVCTERFNGVSREISIDCRAYSHEQYQNGFLLHS